MEVESATSDTSMKADLEGILEQGLRALLIEASTKNALIPPSYGHPDVKSFMNPFPAEPQEPVQVSKLNIWGYAS